MVGNYHVIFRGVPSPQKPMVTQNVCPPTKKAKVAPNTETNSTELQGSFPPLEKSYFEPPKMEFVFLFEIQDHFPFQLGDV